jgi:5-methylcytosine-specific restriction endonuclease McrA
MYKIADNPDSAILDCKHEGMRPVRRIDGSGVLKVYLQCPVCGTGGGARAKKDFDVDALPWWDASLIDERNAAWERERLRRNGEWEQQRVAYKNEFHSRYDRYLRTEQWHALKHAALKRDGYTCQHCGKTVTSSTSQGHHIRPWGYETFNRCGYSMLFEIVTLCVRCHEAAEARLHDE